MDYSGVHNFGLVGDILLNQKPMAQARVKGSSAYPRLTGTVSFYSTSSGVLVLADFTGLPVKSGKCSGGIFGFHIHEGTKCTGNAQDPFADTGGHYNPDKCPHPYHAGDMPPLFGNQGGNAWQAFLTNRFTIAEVIGRTVVVHVNPDDFTTQPSGNSGPKIACGVIMSVKSS